MIGRIVLCLAFIALVACEDAETAEPAPLIGTVIAVDAASLTKINSFTLKAGDDRHEIFIDPDVDYSSSGFVPQHLREHVISGIRVRVKVERRDGRLYATAMQDA